MAIETILIWVLLIIGGYLLGSVMFCRLVCLAFFDTDICKVSKDGNPGAANAFWYCGKVAGSIGLFCDLLKGFLPVFVAIKFLDYQSILFALTMLAPVLGHAFSVFHHFSGGKCIATIYGELLALFVTWTSPLLFVILGVLNLVFEIVFKTPGNKRSFIMFPLLMAVSIPVCLQAGTVATLIGIISISVIAMYKHSSIFATADKRIGNPKKVNLAK